MIKEKVIIGLGILANPEREFGKIDKITIERVTAYYFVLLLIMSLLAGLVGLIFSLLKAVYYDLTIVFDVNYLRLINYSIGSSTSIIFLYLFAGTFVFMVLSFILRIFFKKLGYINILKIMMYSASPLLLFGWIRPAVLALLIWSIFLFWTGVKTSKTTKTKKGSIQQRY